MEREFNIKIIVSYQHLPPIFYSRVYYLLSTDIKLKTSLSGIRIKFVAVE